MHVLMISDLPPCSNHTSGLLLDRLCGYLLDSGHEVSAYIVKTDVVYVVIPENKLRRITFDLIRKPLENWGVSKLRCFGSFVGDNYVNIVRLPAIKRKIAAFAREMQPDLIWGVVQGQTITKLIRPVAERCGLPYIVQVFDPINWWFQTNKVDRWTQKRVMAEYGRMIHNAKCFIGASPEMAAAFAEQYDCPRHVPIMMPFEASGAPGAIQPADGRPEERKERDSFIIALTGQLYAYGTIMSLLAALNDMKWKHAGKRIVFRVYGANMHFDMPTPCYMEYRGWVPQEQLMEELKDVDLLYCPYRFDADFEQTARYAFAGKLCSYMRTGIPLLVHSPDYSSISRFVKRNECGYVLESVVQSDIVQTVKGIMDDDGRYDLARRAVQVSDEQLSAQVMYKNFSYALESALMKEKGNDHVQG